MIAKASHGVTIPGSMFADAIFRYETLIDARPAALHLYKA